MLSSILSVSALIALAAFAIVESKNGYVSHMEIPTESISSTEKWNYVTVRPKAHMFYWLYYTTHVSGYQERPLILWLQGGPGGSGTGFGNFVEFGPLDANLKPRNTTWLQTASLLFVDQPVGTGFSYVEDASAFVKTNDEIAIDMITLLSNFSSTFSDFSKVPFYIFSESYGGKMTASISAHLYKAINQGKLNLNFKGLAMGDSWISPADSVLSWGPYLYATSNVGKSGLDAINEGAQKVVQLIEEGRYLNATAAWNELEGIVEEQTSGVSFYNILSWNEASDGQPEYRKDTVEAEKNYLKRLYHRHVVSMSSNPVNLDAFMNGPIRRKLGIIPENVKWGGQSLEVFKHLSTDFMKNVTSIVNDLINTTPLKVVVYNGQLDLICDVLGTEAWFYRLDVGDEFKKNPKQRYQCNTPASVCYFGQKYKNVEFYWILNAGHMVPSDNGPGALSMVNNIIE